MWKLYYLLSQATPTWLPGYKQGGDNSANSITQGRAELIVQIVFTVFGAVSVLVITIAGIQYIISQGDAQKIAKAKNTIIYAIVGLMISLTGYLIVSYVVNWLA